MTTLELAKLICESGCEVTIRPSEEYKAVWITARNKDKVFKLGCSMENVFSDPEDILDHTIKVSIYQVKDVIQ